MASSRPGVPLPLKVEEFDRLLTTWLEEDVGGGDVTCRSLFPDPLRVSGHILCKEAGVLAGLTLVQRLFFIVDSDTRFEILAEEGSEIKPGQRIARFSGRAASLLTPERLALNLLGHLSGIASLARRYLQEVDGLKVQLAETRKTLPGMRRLEKYATSLGGWVNHRMGLYDLILIKDNHLAALRSGGIEDPVAEALRRSQDQRGLSVEIEVDSPEEAARAARAGAQMILLDNMSIEILRRAVQMARAENPAVFLEASGGVSLETLRSMAETGVDRISIGKVTHSARNLDLSLEVDPGV